VLLKLVTDTGPDPAGFFRSPGPKPGFFFDISELNRTGLIRPDPVGLSYKSGSGSGKIDFAGS